MSESRDGSASLHWNGGGWLGGQLGGTLWMLILGCVLVVRGELVGIALLLAGLAGNAVGWLLWSMRARMRVHFATQLLFAACGAFAALALLAVAQWGRPGLLAEWRLQPWYLVVYPAVMLLVFSLDRGRALEKHHGVEGSDDRASDAGAEHPP